MVTDNDGEITWPWVGENVVNETLPFGLDLEFDPVQHPEKAEYNLTFTNKELDRGMELDLFLQADCVGFLGGLDFKHFIAVASMAGESDSEGFGNFMGWFNEEIIQGPGDPSYNSWEDIPSNNRGAPFGAGLIPDIPLSIQMRAYFQMSGVNMNDQEALDVWKKWIHFVNVMIPDQTGHNEDTSVFYGGYRDFSRFRDRMG